MLQKEEAAEEVEEEEGQDPLLTADLDLTTVEKTLMIQEIDEEAKEEVNLTKVGKAEVEARAVSERRITQSPGQDHFQDQALSVHNTKASINLLEVKSETINQKEIA